MAVHVWCYVIMLWTNKKYHNITIVQMGGLGGVNGMINWVKQMHNTCFSILTILEKNWTPPNHWNILSLNLSVQCIILIVRNCNIIFILPKHVNGVSYMILENIMIFILRLYIMIIVKSHALINPSLPMSSRRNAFLLFSLIC